jgi:hypothetical protein
MPHFSAERHLKLQSRSPDSIIKGGVMKLKTKLRTIFTVATLLTASQPVLAEHYDRGWRGDIRHFEAHDLHRWRTGRWMHGRHDGHLGWWWVVAGIWYFYPAPVYPYPNPYIPPVVIEQQPPVVIQPAPSATVPPPQSSQYWFYCEPAQAYYPYVSSCPSGWKKVPATPPDASQ